MDISLVYDVITRARSMGLHGFGGECALAALALSQTVFKGEHHRIVGFFNAALYEQGHAVGHVAIEVVGTKRTQFFDMDGISKERVRMESWGQLDLDDQTYSQYFDDGLWTTERAHNVISTVLLPEDLYDLFGIQPHQLDWAIQALSSAQRSAQTQVDNRTLEHYKDVIGPRI